MKIKSRNIILIIIMLILWDIEYKNVKTSKKIDRLYLHIDTVMQHRALLDTMYWDHLNQCAFEQRKPLPFIK